MTMLSTDRQSVLFCLRNLQLSQKHFRKTIQDLSSGGIPVTDAIPTEIYKAGGLPMAEKPTVVFTACGGRRRGLVVELRTLEREVGDSILTQVSMLYP